MFQTAELLRMGKKKPQMIQIVIFFFFEISDTVTYDPDHQLIGCIIPPHQQRVVNDEVAGEEEGIAVYGCSQNGLAVGANVQRVVVDQLQKVLIQEDHLAAFLPRIRLDVTIP